MKKKAADDVVLVLSAEGAESVAKALGRSKERRRGFHRLLDSADIHVLDSASGVSLYRWKHLSWRNDTTKHVEDALALLEKNKKHLLFVRLGPSLDDVEVWGDYVKNPFKVAVVREISMAV